MKGELKQHVRKGFTLLVTVLVVGIVLAIGLSILTITLKEYILSGIARESAIALGAADAGMECALYWDRSASPDGGKFATTTSASTQITCMGLTKTIGAGGSGAPRQAEFSWGSPPVCAKIIVTKYNDTVIVPMGLDSNGNPVSCPAGVECTRTESRGYNKACSDIALPRTVERALRARY